jgi:hypothetical protein
VHMCTGEILCNYLFKPLHDHLSLTGVPLAEYSISTQPAAVDIKHNTEAHREACTSALTATVIQLLPISLYAPVPAAYARIQAG